MLINVSPDARTFHLRSRFFSYILTVMENGQIENLYFGKAIQDRPSFASTLTLSGEGLGAIIFTIGFLAKCHLRF